jgi:GcrA cell cycle regulator
LIIWDEDKIALIKRMWDEGCSASIIANELGSGVSRNAVIGKLHRLGIDGNSAPRLLVKRKSNEPRRRVAKPIVAKKVEWQEWPASPVPVEPSEHQLLPARGGCKWPYGDVHDPDFHYCNAPTAGTYCTHHVRRSQGSPRRPSDAAAGQTTGFSYRTYSRYG